MDVVRDYLDNFYDGIKPAVFKATGDDPQIAHELLIKLCSFLRSTGLDDIILDNSSNYHHHSFEIANAAGFNKNGEIHPQVLRYLGFDRVVVGTVTAYSWQGNPRPTIKRYTKTESMVNWMGLPGEGARAVAHRMEKYGNHGIPITINFMSTPGKHEYEVLMDLEKTIGATKYLHGVDRYELNISCPNTHGKSGNMDARTENMQLLGEILRIVTDNVLPNQDVYLKVSPDSTEADVDDTIKIASKHKIKGIVTTNTTTRHNPDFIPVSPEVDGKKVGGASGNAVYDDSLRVQTLYDEKIWDLDLPWRIIACGGINSIKRINKRVEHGASEMQLFTPLIFKGPKLLRHFRLYIDSVHPYYSQSRRILAK